MTTLPVLKYCAPPNSLCSLYFSTAGHRQPWRKQHRWIRGFLRGTWWWKYLVALWETSLLLNLKLVVSLSRRSALSGSPSWLSFLPLPSASLSPSCLGIQEVAPGRTTWNGRVVGTDCCMKHVIFPSLPSALQNLPDFPRLIIYFTLPQNTFADSWSSLLNTWESHFW